MRYRFDECLARGKIVKIPVDPALVEKELREAESDLAAAENPSPTITKNGRSSRDIIHSSTLFDRSYWEGVTGRRATGA